MAYCKFDCGTETRLLGGCHHFEICAMSIIHVRVKSILIPLAFPIFTSAVCNTLSTKYRPADRPAGAKNMAETRAHVCHARSVFEFLKMKLNKNTREQNLVLSSTLSPMHLECSF